MELTLDSFYIKNLRYIKLLNLQADSTTFNWIFIMLHVSLHILQEFSVDIKARDST
jgi:hypothetical protein